MNFFQRIIERIEHNPAFLIRIHYPLNSRICEGNIRMWLTEENDKIYACGYKYVAWDGTVVDFELFKDFLTPYVYRKVSEIKVGNYTRMVIYEIQEDNIN